MTNTKVSKLISPIFYAVLILPVFMIIAILGGTLDQLTQRCTYANGFTACQTSELWGYGGSFGISAFVMFFVGACLLATANWMVDKIDNTTKPVPADHFRQSLLCYLVLVALYPRLNEGPVFLLSIIVAVAIITNAVYLAALRLHARSNIASGKTL